MKEVKTNFISFLKVGFVNLISWVIYFGIESSDKFQKVLSENQTGASSRRFQAFLGLSILKYGALILGIVSLLFFLFLLFKRSKNS